MGLFGRRTYRDRSLPPEWPSGRGPIASTAFATTLTEWMKIVNIAEGRRFLETHMELLQPQSETLLGFMIRLNQSKGQDSAPAWYRLDVLRDIKARGNTRAAIQEAYTDIHNALDAFELPPWLSSMVTKARSLTGTTEQRAAARMTLLRDALVRAKQDRAVAAETTATLQEWLGDSYSELSTPNLLGAIELWEQAFQTFTLKRYPRRFAHLQHSLGAAYIQLAGEAGTNRNEIGRATQCFEQALQVYEREGFPEEWADVQLQLGVAHAALGNKRQARQCLQAAETYFTIGRDPVKWGLIQKTLHASDAPPNDLGNLIDGLEANGVINAQAAKDFRKKFKKLR